MNRKLHALENLLLEFGIKLRKVSENEVEVIEDKVYPLAKADKMGCVLIISNPFDGDDDERKNASDADVKMMSTLWSDEIKCELFDIQEIDANTDNKTSKATSDDARELLRAKIATKNPNKIYEKMNAAEMEELLMSLAETKKDYAYIVVVISTHGGMVTEKWLEDQEKRIKSMKSGENRGEAVVKLKNAEAFREHKKERKSKKGGEAAMEVASTEVFFGEDWSPYREKDMMKLFYNEKTYKLREIPKFFILDYCRNDGGATENSASDKKSKGGNGKGPDVELQRGLPLMSDMVTAYATHRSHEAFDNDKGSWLITSIKEVFSEYYDRKDVLDMLTKVNMKMRSKCDEKDAMSIFESSLVDKFYLYQSTDTTEKDGSSQEEAKGHPKPQESKSPAINS